MIDGEFQPIHIVRHKSGTNGCSLPPRRWPITQRRRKRASRGWEGVFRQNSDCLTVCPFKYSATEGTVMWTRLLLILLFCLSPAGCVRPKPDADPPRYELVIPGDVPERLILVDKDDTKHEEGNGRELYAGGHRSRVAAVLGGVPAGPGGPAGRAGPPKK
jgi:hypothetical protein